MIHFRRVGPSHALQQSREGAEEDAIGLVEFGDAQIAYFLDQIRQIHRVIDPLAAREALQQVRLLVGPDEEVDII
jgi:hypothetical protein